MWSLTPSGAACPSEFCGRKARRGSRRTELHRHTIATAHSETDSNRREEQPDTAPVDAKRPSDLQVRRSEGLLQLGDGRVGLIRRVLSPGLLARPGEAAIHLGLPLPTASCGLPADSGEQPSNIRARHPRAPILTLLRVGFTEPAESPRSLVVSYTTVSPLPAAEAAGGLFSVALSRGSPRVGVTHHPALWSPDVPRRAPEGTRRDRPAGSSAVLVIVAARGEPPVPARYRPGTGQRLSGRTCAEPDDEGGCGSITCR